MATKKQAKTKSTQKTTQKTLGVERRKRRYDLPLTKSAGTGFLKLLIMLMSVLAILALAASFTLSEMKNRWSSGLENKMTIEIPAEDANNVLISHEAVQAMTQRAAQILKTHPAIISVTVMDDQDIQKLVAPWLGNNLAVDAIPMPGLISAEIQPRAVIDMGALQKRLRSVAPGARIDTHETWLRDVLHFTSALQLAAILLTLAIGVTTVVAIAGAVRSRMAEYHEEIELLHLMGAADDYITKQFQKHTLGVAFQGAIAGIVIGTLVLLLVGWLSGQTGAALLPDFRLDMLQKGFLAGSPLLIAILAALTARWTVLHNLVKMP